MKTHDHRFKRSLGRETAKCPRRKYSIGEPVNYDGPPCGMCINSYQQLVRDMFVQIGHDIPLPRAAVIDSSIESFFNAFFKEVQKFQTGEQVEQFASACKERKNDLLELSNMLAINDYSHYTEILFIDSGREDYFIPLRSMRYLPDNMSGVFSYLADCDVVLDSITLNKKPRFYIYLYRILFELILTISDLDVDFERYKDAIRQLYLLPSSMGQIFERLNPTKDVMARYARELLQKLQAPSKPLSKEFVELFELVKEDILNPDCRLAYVSGFKWAMSNLDFVSKFNIKDYYATLKASTSIVVEENGKRRSYPSLISSLIDCDPLLGYMVVEEFDKFIGYESAYIKKEDNPLVVEDDVVRTQEIPNPSKFKPRGIHNGTNAIQDRCNYIHNRLQPLLRRLDTDCLKDHNKGVKFLRQVSSPRYRNTKKNDIFVSDFSNATDTLSQEFQCMCLEIIFPKPIVEFWMFISKLPKVFRMPDGTPCVKYVQETGQPQGLLGSFDAFSLAHHILILMLMKACEFEKISARTFYRILGDDSIISYPHKEEFSVYDVHSWLCQNANLVKNDAKTAKSFFESDGKEYDHIVMDFAKVSVYQGDFCSPLPVGLGIAYATNPKVTKLSAILWFNAHNVTFKKWLHHVIFQCYGDDKVSLAIAESIVSSGQIGYLENFREPDLYFGIDSTITGASIFSYGSSELQSTLFGYFVSDEKKQEILRDRLSYDKLWAGLFPFKQMEEWITRVPENHKFMILAQQAVQIQDEINALYDLGDIALAKDVAALTVNSDMVEDIKNVVDLQSYIQLELDSGELYQVIANLDYNRVFPSNKRMAEMQVRSLRAKATIQSAFLFNAIKEFKKKFMVSSEIREGIERSYLPILEFMETVYSPEEHTARWFM